jgi:hypothetical protein
MNHTTGPWHAQVSEYTGQGQIASEVTGATVAVIFDGAADAALVAAAPDLLAALSSLVEFAHAALSDTIHDDNLRYFERLAYTALDKAVAYRYGDRAAEIEVDHA